MHHSLPLPAKLPDVARNHSSPERLALDWVGMRDIDIALDIGTGPGIRSVPAQADLQVDLPQVETKGIHMSRLYRLLNDTTRTQPITPGVLTQLLADMVHSHADCGTTRARVSLRLALLLDTPALRTPELFGWKRYPVSIDALLVDGVVSLTLEVAVQYASTCPCSAALARQVVSEAFGRHFDASDMVSKAQVLAWLDQHATTATPHSQRSQARVSVAIAPDAAGFGAESLIAAVEAALSTAVQAAVKRADEQAFAALNGGNPMYVEDAARKIAARLQPLYRQLSVQVAHMESLHPHDAVASVALGDAR